MILLRLSLMIWGLTLQAPPPAAPSGPDCLLPQEKSRLLAETKMDNRIKIYDGASNRCQNYLTADIRAQNPQAASAHLKSWMDLLESSLKDVEGSTARKDKSRALIRFEIHLRKAIGNVQELKLKGSADQFDEFAVWLTRAQEIHRKFVGMLFPR